MSNGLQGQHVNHSTMANPPCDEAEQFLSPLGPALTAPTCGLRCIVINKILFC